MVSIVIVRLKICFDMKFKIDGHKILQLGSTDNTAIFDAFLAELAALPSKLILCPSIKDFMQNMFGTPEVCSFPLRKFC